MVVENDLFARHVGIEFIEAAQGSAKARLKIQKHHLNGMELTQGGVVFTLADLVFAAASNSYGPDAVAINANISFVKASTEGAVLTAEAKEVSRDAKLATYTILVTDEMQDTIAIFQGMVYIKAFKK
jgi:acyl-CoA thioesterase